MKLFAFIILLYIEAMVHTCGCSRQESVPPIVKQATAIPSSLKAISIPSRLRKSALNVGLFVSPSVVISLEALITVFDHRILSNTTSVSSSPTEGGQRSFSYFIYSMIAVIIGTVSVVTCIFILPHCSWFGWHLLGIGDGITIDSLPQAEVTTVVPLSMRNPSTAEFDDLWGAPQHSSNIPDGDRGGAMGQAVKLDISPSPPVRATYVLLN